MTITTPRLVLTFLDTSTTTTVTTTDIVFHEIKFEYQLLNGFSPSSNKVSLQLKQGAAAIHSILATEGDVKAVLYDNTSVLFTGYLSDNHNWVINSYGEQAFNITIEDVGTKLLGKAFLSSDAPSLYTLKGYVNSGNNSVVSQICSRAGITLANNQPSITGEVCANVDKNLTCRDLLTSVLLESGYTYYFNSNGQLCLFKIDCSSTSGVPVINGSNLYVVNNTAIALNKKAKQYKQVNVSYDEYETRTGVLVYKDVSGQDTDHPDCNFVIKPNSYYPVGLYEVATVAAMKALGTGDVSLGNYVRVLATNDVYEVVELGTPGADETGTSYSFVLTTVSQISYVEAEDIDKGRDIISISNVSGTVVYSGSLTYEISQRGAKNIAVVLHNTGSSDTTVTKLQATADIIDIKSKCILTAGETVGTDSSNNIYSASMKYLHTKKDAQIYANMMADYFKYCNYSYQFFANQDYALGTVVNVVDNIFSGLTVNLLLTAKQLNDKSGTVKYTGVTISPFDLTAAIVSENTLSPDSVGVPGPAGKSPLTVAFSNKVFSTSSTGFIIQQQDSEILTQNTNSFTITADDSSVEYMKTGTGNKVYPFLLGIDKATIPTQSGATIDFTGIYTDSGDLLTDIFDAQGFSSPYTALSNALSGITLPVTLPDASTAAFYHTLLKSGATQAAWTTAYWPLDVNSLKVEASDGTYTSRDTLSVIKTDAALPTYQYAMTTGSTPVAADWSDVQPTGWYVGCVYWMRIKYTWEDGSETYSDPWEDTITNDLMADTATFEISSDKSVIEKDLRSSDTETVTFTAISTKYINPTYTWNINGVSYSGSSVTFSFAKNAAPAVITASCNLTSLVGSTTYNAGPRTANLSCVDVTEYNINYGILAADPASAIDGDSYVKQVGEDFYPYVFTQGAWTQITNVANYPTEIAQCRDVILANGVNVKQTSAALYGYFRNLSAQNAQIDYLSTETISLQDGGVIKSDNYTEDSSGNPITGFYMDYDGNSKFVNSTIVDATVSGSFTSNPLETRDETPGTAVTGSWGSTAYYNDGTVYTAIANNTTPGTLTSITTGTHTYGNSTISSVLRLTENTQRTAQKTLAQNNSVTGSASINGTMPVHCSNVTVTATPLVKRFTSLAGTVTRTATTQYSTDNSNWTSFSGAKTLSRSYGASVYARQVYDSSSGTFGSISSWERTTTGSNIGKIVYANGIFLATSAANVSYIMRSTDGKNWSQVTPAGSGTMFNLCSGNNMFILAVNSTNNNGIYKSTDGINWTKTLNVIGYAVYFGNNEFRAYPSSGSATNYYYSSDGSTWTDGGYSGYGVNNTDWFYVNGQWIRLGGTTNVKYSQANDILFRCQWGGSSNGTIQTSTDGSTWTTVYTGSDVDDATILYANGYYIRNTQPNSQSSTTYLAYSTNLSSWTTISNSSGYMSAYGIYANGLIIFGGNVSSTSTYGVRTCKFQSYTDSDFTVVTTGKLAIKYDYSYYPLGANLLDSSTSILATKQNDSNSWDTTKTTITSYSLNPTAYYKFSSFNVNSFDARKYNSGSTFNIIYTKFDGSSLNLTSSTSGGYTYNAKWNGSTFSVYLNGALVGSFTDADYFTSGSVAAFTPVAQTDAALVKDVIPKADSTYTIGEQGNEFATGYIDLIYGNVVGDLSGHADSASNASYANSAGTAGTCSGNAATATTWQTARNFTITDGTHTGTATSVSGSAAVTLNLPTYIYGAVFN